MYRNFEYLTFFIISVLIVLLNIIEINSQIYYPNSPCPNIFQYRYNGNEWFGILKINLAIIPIIPSSIVELIETTTSLPPIIHVKVILSQKGTPPPNYLGEIEILNKSRNVIQEQWEQMKKQQHQQLQGIFNKMSYNNDKNPFLLYKVVFPNGQNPPRLREVVVNNKLLCSGPADADYLVTIIKLEHTRRFAMRPYNDLLVLPSSFEHKDTEQELSDDIITPPLRINNSAKICGRTKSNKLFTTNKTLIRGAWPWLAAIYVNNLTTLSYQCSGNVISSRIILSAAHCLHNYKSNDILIFLGRFNLNNWNEDNSLAISCDNIYIHPDFDENLKTFDADIALIILKRDIQFNDYIRPVCLWTGSTNLEYIKNEQGYVVGWSNDKNYNSNNNDDQNLEAIPKLIQPIIITNNECLRLNEKFKNLVTERNFCTENDNNSSKSNLNSICNGYSGAGIMVKRNNQFILRGIVSATLPSSELDLFETLSSSSSSSSSVTMPSSLFSTMSTSCNTDKITIYTDVAKFLDWITAFLI